MRNKIIIIIIIIIIITKKKKGKELLCFWLQKQGRTEECMFYYVAAEALAALEAFQFCHSMGRDRVMVVGDAKQVVDAVLSGEPDWSYKGHMNPDSVS
jgi:hypothetical protein